MISTAEYDSLFTYTWTVVNAAKRTVGCVPRFAEEYAVRKKNLIVNNLILTRNWLIGLRARDHRRRHSVHVYTTTAMCETVWTKNTLGDYKYPFYSIT